MLCLLSPRWRHRPPRRGGCGGQPARRDADGAGGRAFPARLVRRQVAQDGAATSKAGPMPPTPLPARWHPGAAPVAALAAHGEAAAQDAGADLDDEGRIVIWYSTSRLDFQGFPDALEGAGPLSQTFVQASCAVLSMLANTLAQPLVSFSRRSLVLMTPIRRSARLDLFCTLL